MTSPRDDGLGGQRNQAGAAALKTPTPGGDDQSVADKKKNADEYFNKLQEKGKFWIVYRGRAGEGDVAGVATSEGADACRMKEDGEYDFHSHPKDGSKTKVKLRKEGGVISLADAEDSKLSTLAGVESSYGRVTNSGHFELTAKGEDAYRALMRAYAMQGEKVLELDYPYVGDPQHTPTVAIEQMLKLAKEEGITLRVSENLRSKLGECSGGTAILAKMKEGKKAPASKEALAAAHKRAATDSADATPAEAEGSKRARVK